MKKVLVMMLMGLSLSAMAQRDKAEAYINLYKDIAIAEMQRTGVPASITLAQGILESAYGQSDLALQSNNHFGIKCKTEWTGAKTYHDDDTKQECFRVYPSVADSYRDHSNFLLTREWYAFLFKLDPTDDKGWAYGLKKAGYATEKDYPLRLLKIINDYQLQQYSLMALNKSSLALEVNKNKSSIDSEQNKLKDDAQKMLNTVEPQRTTASESTSLNASASIPSTKRNRKQTKAADRNKITTKNNKDKRRRVINQSDNEPAEELVEAPVKISKDLIVSPTVVLNKVTEETEKEEATESEVVSGRSGPSANEDVKIPTGYPDHVFTINHAQVIYAEAGLSLLSIANKYNLSLSKIYEFNELSEMDILDKGQLIFLEKKLKKGSTDFYIPKGDETLLSISQKEGVRLESLMEYNKLKRDAIAHEGDKIYLRPQVPASNTAAKAPKK